MIADLLPGMVFPVQGKIGTRINQAGKMMYMVGNVKDHHNECVLLLMLVQNNWSEILSPCIVLFWCSVVGLTFTLFLFIFPV